MSNSSSKAAGKAAQGKRAAKGKNASPGVSKGLLIGAGAVFALLFAAFVAFTSNKPPAPPPSAIGGEFQLVDHDGKPFTDKDMLGRPFLVFFGYTHCPDICHTTTLEMSDILRAMPDAKIGALFVTVDPERDTPAVLKDYLANFDSRIVGLTGAHDALDPMLREYRIFSKRVPSKTDDYSVDHTTVVYLMNKNGKFVNAFDVTRKPADAARALQPYL